MKDGAKTGLVPAPRLLLAVGGVALLAVPAGAWPELAAAWVLALAGVAAVAATDLAWSMRTWRPLRVEVPPVVRLAKDRAGAMPLTWRGGDAGAVVRVGVGLPAGFVVEPTEARVVAPAADKSTCIQWSTTATRRGRFTGVVVAQEQASRLGCWGLRRREEVACELRVYPDLRRERRAMAALFLNRGRLGAKLQRTVGRGRDFEKLREYQTGDGFDEIHWKATAKRGFPVTKVFQAERTQEIYVVIDASRLSARTGEREGRTETALERYLTAAMVLLLAAERQGDRFGLVTFSAGVDVFLRAGSGAGHYGACREAVHALQPRAATPEMGEIVRVLRTRLRQRALLLVLTDLSDPVLAEDLTRQVEPLARQHLVLVNQIRPPQVGPLFAAGGGEVHEADELYGRLAGHLRWAELRATAQQLRARGVTAQLLEEEALAVEMVAQYLAVKQRQAL